MSALSIFTEECELLNDSKYRSYITQVEKALKSFEYTSEWADLISALGKLNKVLLAHVKYRVIPKRVTIGKRLAQCLHPALPSGVHLKALETYDIIFKCIGTQRLAQDLFIYSAGLFPLLSHAAMNVKPVLLMIYERHFLGLGKQIKPALNGLLLGLLPGLEEGSEFYDRTNLLLDDVCENTEPEYFYTCLWECVYSCPSVRLPAVTYLLSHYNKKQIMEDQLFMIGLNINLMVDALCNAVQDTSVLVQRSFLDFLLLAFPLHNGQLTRSDMKKIVQAAINVLLRRDMSLNRRLYAWLLGTISSSMGIIKPLELSSSNYQQQDCASDSTDTNLAYFNTYSRDLLVQALKMQLAESHEDGKSMLDKSSVLKPFRILISLLDKPEIGPVILESVLLGIVKCLYKEFSKSKLRKESEKSSKRNRMDGSQKEATTYGELLKTANLLFGTFAPYFIWDYIARIFDLACQSGYIRRSNVTTLSGSSVSRQSSLQDQTDQPSISELCELVTFLLDIMSLETFLETQTEHLPDLLNRIIISLTNHCDVVMETEITCTLQLCTKILSKVHIHVSHSTQARIKSEDEMSMKSEAYMKTQNSASSITNSKTTDFDEVFTITGENITDNSLFSESIQCSINKSENVSVLENSFEKVSSKGQCLTLMQTCILSFETFFHVLISKKIIKNPMLISKCISAMTVSRECCQHCDLNSDLELGYEVNKEVQEEKDEQKELKVSVDDLVEGSLEMFGSACKLMVDFASFPIYCTDVDSLLDECSLKEDITMLPNWLEDLLTCSCFVDNFHIQSSAISTTLDLIILTQSIQMENSSTPHDQRMSSSTEGTVSVMILPTLHPKHLKYLSDHMMFFKLSAKILWNYLGDETAFYHQQTVKLFHTLHQVVPHAWVCENVIGQSLVSENEVERIESFKKFTILWHLTRDIKTEIIPGKPLRTYERSMFVVLDSLKVEASPVKILAATWLTHVVQHGDISRVMEPFLQMLLHPDTARVSIQHVNIHQPRKVRLSESEDDSSQEAKIYAISSEGGNVIYHVSTKRREFAKSSLADLKSYALTVLNEQGTAATAPVKSRSLQELNFEKVNPNDLNLRVNPFGGSENSLDRLIFDGSDFPATHLQQKLNKAKRLDKETCIKEGISFETDVINDQNEKTDDSSLLKDVRGDPGNNKNEVNAEEIVQDIISDILTEVFRKCETTKSNRDHILLRSESTASSNLDISNNRHGIHAESHTSSETDAQEEDQTDRSTELHPLHMHILLYTQKYDYQRTLYALSALKSMLVTCPRLLVTALVTTSISAVRPSQLVKLQLLLARHRKSVFGKNFFGDIPAEVMSAYRSSMFIEILISVCLYFIRGYYPNLMSKLSHDELLGNKEVHIVAAETLTLIVTEVISIMRDSGKNFVSFISDLLQRCKVQKALFHCILASIHNCRKRKGDEHMTHHITEAIIAFNEENLDSSLNETFQIKLLNFLLVMMILEKQIQKFEGESVDSTAQIDLNQLRINSHVSLLSLKYAPGQPIVQQIMFISSVISALKQLHMCHMHRHWVALVTSGLLYMGKHLPSIVLSVVWQLCRNLEAVAMEYEASGKESAVSLNKIPPDYAVTMLNGLMTICHYCLLDNVSPVSINQPAPTSTSITMETVASGNILANLLHVFNPVGGARETSPQRELGSSSPVLEARGGLLSILPRIMACMTSLWKAMNNTDMNDFNPAFTMGAPKVVRQYILEFVSPLSRPHGLHLLGAIAVAWNDRRQNVTSKNGKKVGGIPCNDQLLLVELVGAIKVMPMDTLIQTVKQVLKQPPPSDLGKGKKNIPLEVNLLQFFYAYVQQVSAGQLVDSWTALLTLLKEAQQLNLQPPGMFLLLQILYEFVMKTPAMEDKKNLKELQEISQKLLEAVAFIAGSSLEQTTWLRRNYAVKPGPQADITDPDDMNLIDDGVQVATRRVKEPDPSTNLDSKYSVQALMLLAELMAPLLDVIYSSDEKDKVAPFLATIMYSVFPYLRNHSTHNLPSLRASSQLLATISSYQFTRKAWRKEALELLLDPSFFQMDVRCIQYWHTVIDNLMTHDKTTFKELMARVSLVQTGSLNIFSNKDHEMDQKAQMLRRLAFSIFCSESDQYQKSLPEIQERLAESLRMLQVPSVIAQVFLCFRVLILRISPQHLTSMWPTIITEMVHVCLQIEQELSAETEEYMSHVQKIASLDSSWAHLGNGLNAHNNPSWLHLYLSVAKLLDLCLALPADMVPQFQLYRWAFIGGAAAGEMEEVTEEKGDEKTKPKQAVFTPHIIRLSKLFNSRIQGDVPVLKMTHGRPLLTMTYLRSLSELQPFFNTLCMASQSENIYITSRGQVHSGTRKNGRRLLPKSKSIPSILDQSDTNVLDLQHKTDRQFIEELLERDFLELMS
ncbi:hypothetical protein CHS0354_034162 [Potamilus streckersoni]|uniref:Uncharacterized protein n=1 Tax=Potamilus streckersoni TaxID=2493646 RepID=A0AAE0RN55_9BIVA|nr:hypothetical protein CHS0354_034162 [Potamilus streckersoni]